MYDRQAFTGGYQMLKSDFLVDKNCKDILGYGIPSGRDWVLFIFAKILVE
jgi:hypothetical protein